MCAGTLAVPCSPSAPGQYVRPQTARQLPLEAQAARPSHAPSIRRGQTRSMSRRDLHTYA